MAAAVAAAPAPPTPGGKPPAPGRVAKAEPGADTEAEAGAGPTLEAAADPHQEGRQGEQGGGAKKTGRSVARSTVDSNDAVSAPPTVAETVG